MRLKFFANHCISNFIIEKLFDEGYKVFRLREYIPQDSPDPVVILKAQKLNSILISLKILDYFCIIVVTPERKLGINGR